MVDQKHIYKYIIHCTTAEMQFDSHYRLELLVSFCCPCGAVSTLLHVAQLSAKLFSTYNMAFAENGSNLGVAAGEAEALRDFADEVGAKMLEGTAMTNGLGDRLNVGGEDAIVICAACQRENKSEYDGMTVYLESTERAVGYALNGDMHTEFNIESHDDAWAAVMENLITLCRVPRGRVTLAETPIDSRVVRVDRLMYWKRHHFPVERRLWDQRSLYWPVAVPEGEDRKTNTPYIAICEDCMSQWKAADEYDDDGVGMNLFLLRARGKQSCEIANPDWCSSVAQELASATSSAD